ncbi:MAG TPA: hypothetical protein VGB20_05410 [bacterium]
MIPIRAGYLILVAAVGMLAVSPVLAQDTEPPVTEPPAVEEPPSDLDEQASTPEGVAKVTQQLAGEFGVEESVIGDLRQEQFGFGEIHHALSLAEQLPGGATQENIDQVVAMRTEQKLGWGQISQELGTKLGTVNRPGSDGSSALPAPDEGAAAQSVSREGTSRGQGSARATGLTSAPGQSVTRGGGGSSGPPAHAMGSGAAGGVLGYGGEHGRSASAPGHNR